MPTHFNCSATIIALTCLSQIVPVYGQLIQDAGGFENDRFGFRLKVGDEYRYGYTDPSGAVVVPPRWATLYEFTEGLAPVGRASGDSEEFGFIDRDGRVVVEPVWHYVEEFSQGRAVVTKLVSRRTGERKSGYIDKNGSIVIAPIFDSASEFTEGLAAVERNGKYGFINLSGRTAISFQFDYASPFSNGLAAVRKGEKMGYIDKSGSTVIPMHFDDVSSFYDKDFAKVKLNRKEGIIRRDGSWLVQPTFYYIGVSFDEDLWWVKQVYNRCGYVNREGDSVIDYKFADVASFSDGRAAAAIEVDGEFVYGVINKTGDWICEPMWEMVYPYSGGLAVVRKRVGDSYRYGAIDRKGDVVIPVKLHNLDSFNEEGVAKAKYFGKLGLVDVTGEFVLDVVPSIQQWINTNKEYLQSVERGDERYAHVYTGRVFETKAGILRIEQRFVITGVDRRGGKVTVRSENRDENGKYYYQEILISQVPK